MPVSVKVSIVSVTIDAVPCAKRPEEVAVGDQAEPLVPRVVRRLEVLVDVDLRRAAALMVFLRMKPRSTSGRLRLSW